MDELNISSNETLESISVIKVTGARLQPYTKIQAKEYVLFLDAIRPGIYFVEVRSVDNKKHINRLIKR